MPANPAISFAFFLFPLLSALPPVTYWKVSKDLHKFSQLCATRILVLFAYLVSQMPFVPLFAAALALSDGGHRVQIQQIAGSTEIVLAHDIQRSQVATSAIRVNCEQGDKIQTHPDHRIHFQQAEQSDLLVLKAWLSAE